MSQPRIPGLAFARYAKAMVIAKGNPSHALAFAEGQGRAWAMESPDTLMAIKAAVDIMTTGNAASLSQVQTLRTEFLGLVRPRSLVDRIPGIRVVPPNTQMLKFTGGAAVYWVGEASPKPVSRFSIDRVALGHSKLVCIVVTTDELLRNSTLSAEAAFTTEMVRGVASASDAAFIDPGIGPVAGVSPGSVTYGAPSFESSGSSTAAAQADFSGLIARFVAGGGLLEEAIIVLHPRTAANMGLMTAAGGGLAFPSIGARGGEIAGVPAYTSSVCSLAGSPGETFAAIFDASRILRTDGDEIDVNTSFQASVQMNDAPGSGAQALVSLFQNNLAGIKVERTVDWRRADDAAVVVLRGILY